MRITDFKAVWEQTRNGGIRMGRRLGWYFISLTAIVLAAVFVFLTMFGLFGSTEANTASILNTYLNEYAASVESHYNKVAAQGISLSQTLSALIEEELVSQNMAFADLADNQKAVEDMENATFRAVWQSLLMSDASGAYFIMDTTVNTALPNAETFKSGLYLKISNVNTRTPVNPEILLYRGVPSTARNNGFVLHNNWELEFDVDDFAFWDAIKEKASADLMKNYCFAPAVDLPQTWERAMYLAVPVFGADGTLYGVCGLEMSSIYYAHSHMLSASDFRNVAGLLAVRDKDAVIAGSGLESGAYSGYSAGIADEDVSVRKQGGLALYSAQSGEFVGLDKTVKLSPIDGETQWTIAVMTPKGNCGALQQQGTFAIVLFGLLLLIISMLSSVLRSRKYVRPILSGFEAMKQSGGKTRAKITEIDDLMDFLAEQDEAKDAERQKLEEQLSKLGAEAEDARIVLPSREAYEAFLKNLEMLAKAGRKVFDLYRAGRRAKDMPDIIGCSANNIKWHNKNIYGKLWVSSREELLGYIKMMKDEEEVKINESGSAP
jgi:DNA-binding CsgD family transcriptional regulator